MDHGVADFHTGRVAIEQQTSGFALQQRHQRGEVHKVVRLGDQRRGELTVQALQRATQFASSATSTRTVGRAKNFLL